MSEYDNYIEETKKKLLLNILNIFGYHSFDDMRYITYNQIQNVENEEKIKVMLPALRTVYKTYNIRSITNKRNDKRFCLNLLRQLLKDAGYYLESKTYHIIKNGKITSSTKYRIIKA